MTQRKFTDEVAVRGSVPLWIGLTGAAGSGKTHSALRLATGIQRVSGGEIFVIDTENGRSKMYADDYKFRHTNFVAPFGPLDYLAAVQHCVDRGAKVIIIDSMSHEHEGPGGVLEQHDEEEARLSKAWDTSRDKVKFSAWQKPKKARRRLINTLLQMGVNIIMCFRAKEKLKVIPGKNPQALGWMPIGADEYAYEMTVHGVLPPGSEGVPDWKPARPGEDLITKVPKAFKRILAKGKQIDEAMGEAMARYCAGDATDKPSRPQYTPPEGETKWTESDQAFVDELEAKLRAQRTSAGIYRWLVDNDPVLKALKGEPRKLMLQAYKDHSREVREAEKLNDEGERYEDEAAEAEEYFAGQPSK